MNQRKRKTTLLEELTQLRDDCQSAQEVINITSTIAQAEFKEFIESVVSDALQLVFGPEYYFEMENKVVRNQPETYLYSVQDDIRNLLKDDMDGGGLLDVVSLALRTILWAIETNKTSAIMFIDEPLKNIDAHRLILMGEMIRKLSEMLGIQFIIVTHEDGLMNIADKSFIVTRKKDTAKVKVAA